MERPHRIDKSMIDAPRRKRNLMNYRTSVFIALALLATGLTAQTLSGTWELYPPQAKSYQMSLQPPINLDGSSVWSNKSTVMVQYKMMQGAGPVVFSSYGDGSTYSFLYFGLTNPITIEQLTTLSAVYQFASGNCHAGSLRWTIYLQDGSEVHAYYGDLSTQFQTTCTDALNNLSGVNLLDATRQAEGRYELQGSGSPLYVPWATILAEKAGATVTAVNFVLDSGYAGDQVLTEGYPQNVTVGTSDGSTARFIPAISGLTPVCPTQAANIQVYKQGSGGNYTVDEVLSTNAPDSGTLFRMVDCKYMYNISGKSLGSGQYKVDILINGGVPAFQPAPGTVFTLK
jgi:hypothetical protein